MNNDERKALSLLSLAAKAGRIVSGGFMTERAILEGAAMLVIIAADASGNTRKKFTNKCEYYNVPYIIFNDSDTLGRQIGKQSRTTLAVTDQGFANQIKAKLMSNDDMEV